MAPSYFLLARLHGYGYPYVDLLEDLGTTAQQVW